MTHAPSPSDTIESLADLEGFARQIGARASRGEIALMDAAERVWEIARSSGIVARHGEDAVHAHAFAAFDAAHRQTDLEIALRAADGLTLTRMADIEMRAIEWLWPDRIAIGKLTEFAGVGGIGKSTLLFDIAARVSRGDRWPDNPVRGVPQSVFILSAEDDPADTIKPRLTAAGADMDKVFFLSMRRTELGEERGFDLQADIARLEQRIRQVGDVGLVAIDPLTAYFGKANVNSDTAVRRVLKPLGDLAARTRVAMLGSNHFSKTEGGGVMRRMLGAAAFVNAPRIVFIVAPDPHDPERRLLLPAKANLTGRKTGLAFRIMPAGVGDGQRVAATRIGWEDEPVAMTADEALAALKQHAAAAGQKAQAMAFLRDTLSGGPKPAREVVALAAAAGNGERTLQRAREALGIKPKKAAGPHGGWTWALPEG